MLVAARGAVRDLPRVLAPRIDPLGAQEAQESTREALERPSRANSYGPITQACANVRVILIQRTLKLPPTISQARRIDEPRT